MTKPDISRVECTHLLRYQNIEVSHNISSSDALNPGPAHDSRKSINTGGMTEMPYEWARTAFNPSFRGGINIHRDGYVLRQNLFVSQLNAVEKRGGRIYLRLLCKLGSGFDSASMPSWPLSRFCIVYSVGERSQWLAAVGGFCYIR